MLVTRISRPTLTGQAASQLSKAVIGLTQSSGVLVPVNLQLNSPASSLRQFSSTPRTSLRDYFPEAEHDGKVFKTEAAWKHPL